MVSEIKMKEKDEALKSLNPCSNGTWSRSADKEKFEVTDKVLILVLMEHGLGVPLKWP